MEMDTIHTVPSTCSSDITKSTLTSMMSPRSLAEFSRVTFADEDSNQQLHESFEFERYMSPSESIIEDENCTCILI